MGRRQPPGTARIPKKSKEDKLRQAKEIRDSLPTFQRVYVLQFSNTGAEHLADIRRNFRNSTLFLGKKSTINYAFGMTRETEAVPGISNLNSYLGQNTGIFLTNEAHETVTSFFQGLTCSDYANTGDIATETFVVPEGPLPQFQFSMDSFLRELGLPVKLDNMTIFCVRDYTVCTAGEPLTKNAASLLKQFQHPTGEFSVRPICMWEGGNITTFEEQM